MEPTVIPQDESSKVKSDEYNLDLSSVGDEDLQTLGSEIEKFYKTDNRQKISLSSKWERVHHNIDGNQWLMESGSKETGRMWTELKVSKANDYIPRPVTNYTFDAYQTLKAYLIQQRPKSYVYPNSQTNRDKNAAKLAELVSECNWERLNEQENYEYAASCGTTYGTVFKKDFWDMTSAMMAKIPRTEEQPQIDPNTGMPTGEMQEVEVADEMGDPVYDYIPLGDVNSEVVEPYRMAIDPLAHSTSNARWLMEYEIRPISWILEMFDQEGEGYTGLANTVTPESGLSDSLRTFYELKTSTGIKSSANFKRGSDGQDGSTPNSAVVKWYFEAPSINHPKGRMVVVANKVVLYAGESPCEGPEQGDWHPYSDFRWEPVAGRFWAKGPLDDICELQKRLNSIDAAIILTRKTMAIPQKLVPKGAAIAQGSWTGRPGQMIKYRGNIAPSTVPATGVDASVWEERKQILEAIKNISGAVDILKGDRPPGVTAASALEMLFEVATGKLKPTLERWKRFIENSQKKQLKLVARNYKEPREEFIKLLHAKNKHLSPKMIENFLGETLYDNCNVIIEASSSIPKLQSVRKMQLLQVANTGALMLDKPENRMKFLEDMGISGYDTDVSPDVKRAEAENDILDESEGPVPTGEFDEQTGEPMQSVPGVVVLAFEKHDIHLEKHMQRMKEMSFMELTAEAQAAYMAHISEHQHYQTLEKQQAMLEAAMTGQEPAGPQNNLQPEKTKESGKGISQDATESMYGTEMSAGQKVQL